MFDTHCHLTSKHFNGRVRAILDDAERAGVRGAITVSVSSENAGLSLRLAEEDPRLWCSAGVHPLYADQPRDWDAVRTVAASPKCVAWGELGLDHHYEEPAHELQETVLGEQLAVIEAADAEALAEGRLPLPIIVHCRKAVPRLLDVLRGAGPDPSRYVFHCFTETPADARTVLDFGAWISFTGVVTFKGAPEVAEAARLVPEDRLMVETDAPYLTPAPHRKVFPNEPKHVVHTARRLAELRGVDPVALERTLDANAERFFRIQLPGKTL